MVQELELTSALYVGGYSTTIVANTEFGMEQVGQK